MGKTLVTFASEIKQVSSRKLASVSSPFYIARFHSLVKSGSPTDCWQWQGKCDRAGYGQCDIAGLGWAHRVAYRLSKGPIPRGLSVMHSCDNPPCCNPNHLRLGTQLQNIADRVAKGRSVHGTRHPRAKLTDDLVREMRQRFANGESTVKLGREYGVAGHVAWAAINKQTWKHVA